MDNDEKYLLSWNDIKRVLNKFYDYSISDETVKLIERKMKIYMIKTATAESNKETPIAGEEVREIYE